MRAIDQNLGRAFEDADLAQCYAARPPYPPELYEALFRLTPRHQQAADLGCGPGKIAQVLADRFDRVEAIDPSASMIAAGRKHDAGAHPNIEWLTAAAEDAALAGPYDLVTAGASVHWMRHETIFPRLAAALRPAGTLAIISGDDVSSAPWLGEWTAFTFRWLTKLGQVPDAHGYDAALRSYQDWLDVAGSASFSFAFTQSLSDFITCQHSRATWSRAAMGTALAKAYDDQLWELLQPYCVDASLRYEVSSRLVWGRPRTQPLIAGSQI
jgi:SAM-dependent methyltransferase